MEQQGKIGVGIITYNRKPGLLKLYHSLPRESIDALVIVNDGDAQPEYQQLEAHVIQNPQNLGVGKSKNLALAYLQQQNVEHFFLIEDDIYLKSPEVFHHYILHAELTGIQHFNFALHGPYNVTEQGAAKPIAVYQYGERGVQLPLYPACVGAFSYYSRQALRCVGGMDEQFYNALEHIEHSLRIISAGLHPAYGYFADVPNSGEYLGDEGWSEQQSTIGRQQTFRAICYVAALRFEKKYGYAPKKLHRPPIHKVTQQLTQIYQRDSNLRLGAPFLLK